MPLPLPRKWYVPSQLNGVVSSGKTKTIPKGLPAAVSHGTYIYYYVIFTIVLVTLAGFLHVSSVPDQIRYVNQIPVSLSALSNPLLTLVFFVTVGVWRVDGAGALVAASRRRQCGVDGSSGVEGREVTVPFVTASHTLRRQICSLILSSSLFLHACLSTHIQGWCWWSGLPCMRI